MRFMASYIVSGWLCYLVPAEIFAQAEGTVVRTFSMIEGLPAEGINSVMQDSRGFIWLGTYSGLTKFDGYTFTTYAHNPSSDNSLRSNHVSSTWEDKKGYIWISHAEGVDIFDPGTERFLLHWPDNGSHKLAGLRLREAKNGRLWICTSHGIYLADTKTFSITRALKFPVWWTWDVTEMHDSAVVIAQNGSGFYYHNPKTGQSLLNTHDPNNPKSIGPNFFSWKVHVDKENRVWIGTQGGLELFDPRDTSFTHYATHRRIIHIFEDLDGKLILSSDKGLLRFDPTSRQYDTLMLASANSSMRDRQGILWTASLDGLRQIIPRKKKFILSERFGTSISSVLEDASKNIWILGLKQERQAVYKIDSSGTVSTYPMAQRKDPSSNQGLARSLFPDKDQNIWQASIGILEKFDQTHTSLSNFRIPTHLDPLAFSLIPMRQSGLAAGVI